MMRTTSMMTTLALSMMLVACPAPRSGSWGEDRVLYFFDESAGPGKSKSAPIGRPVATGSDFLVSIKGERFASISVDTPDVFSVMTDTGRIARLHALNPGEARVTVTSESGKTDSFRLRVADPFEARFRMGHRADSQPELEEQAAAILPGTKVYLGVMLYDETLQPLTGVNGAALTVSAANMVTVEPIADTNVVALEMVAPGVGTVTTAATNGEIELATIGLEDVARLKPRPVGGEMQADGTIFAEVFVGFRVFIDVFDRADRRVFGNGGERFTVEAKGDVDISEDSTDLSDPQRTFFLVGEGRGEIAVEAVGLRASYDVLLKQRD